MAMYCNKDDPWEPPIWPPKYPIPRPPLPDGSDYLM